MAGIHNLNAFERFEKTGKKTRKSAGKQGAQVSACGSYWFAWDHRPIGIGRHAPVARVKAERIRVRMKACQRPPPTPTYNDVLR